MSKIENIKELYAQVEDKKAFIAAAAKYFNQSPESIRTNWFSRFGIPKMYNVQDTLIDMLQKAIKNQNNIKA